MYENVKNVIFDVGSVLIGYRWHEVIMEYGYEPVKAFAVGHAMLDDEMWNKMDRGDVTFEELLEYYKKKLPEETELIDYFFEHKEKMVVYRPYLYSKIEELIKKGYRIYILSNYSKVLFPAHSIEFPFMDKLSGMVISYTVNSVKPERKIYDELLSQYSLKPEECLFFDDRKANTDAAERLGITCVTVSREDDILTAVDKLLDNRR